MIMQGSNWASYTQNLSSPIIEAGASRDSLTQSFGDRILCHISRIGRESVGLSALNGKNDRFHEYRENSLLVPGSFKEAILWRGFALRDIEIV
jgi:hypothetical protein